jgi:hypothetical protein
MFRKESNSPTLIGSDLLYLIGFIPSSIVIALNLHEESLVNLFLIQVCLMATMIFIYSFSDLGFSKNKPSGFKINWFINCLIMVSCLCILFCIFNNYKHMAFTGFKDVYLIRFSEKIYTSWLFRYSETILLYSLIPFLLAIGLVRRNFYSLFIGIIGSLILYMSLGSKLAILMPLIIGLIYLTQKINRFTFFEKMIFFIISSLLFIKLFMKYKFLLWVKSIFFVRLLSMPGWGSVKYYEFFSDNGYTYWSHIDLVDYFLRINPYNELILGQVIGRAYARDNVTCINSWFIASDAFASAGLFGLPVMAIFLVILYFLINLFASRTDPFIASIGLIGFWAILLNGSLTTAIWSGGLFIIIVLFFFILSAEKFFLWLKTIK